MVRSNQWPMRMNCKRTRLLEKNSATRTNHRALTRHIHRPYNACTPSGVVALMSVVKIARKNSVALGLVALVRKPVVKALPRLCGASGAAAAGSLSSVDLGLLRSS